MTAAQIARKRVINKACQITHRAIRRGELIDLQIVPVKCADCSRRATVYDHRSYDEPLNVIATCGGCNTRRGRGSISDKLLQAEIARVPARYLSTLPRSRDTKKLAKMLKDGKWHNIEAEWPSKIRWVKGFASQLEVEWGGHAIERRRLNGGGWEYRVV